MLIGKVRMIYLLTAMLAVGAGAGFASHEDTKLQVQAAEEAALKTYDDAAELFTK